MSTSIWVFVAENKTSFAAIQHIKDTKDIIKDC